MAIIEHNNTKHNKIIQINNQGQGDVNMLQVNIHICMIMSLPLSLCYKKTKKQVQGIFKRHWRMNKTVHTNDIFMYHRELPNQRGEGVVEIYAYKISNKKILKTKEIKGQQNVTYYQGFNSGNNDTRSLKYTNDQ